MTILEPNQPWPQVYFRRKKYTSELFGYWEEGHEDDSITNLVMGAKHKIMVKNFDGATTLFVGPRAANKIKDLITQNEFLGNMITTKFFEGTLNGEKKFLGMQLVLTVDDGLWIA